MILSMLILRQSIWYWIRHLFGQGVKLLLPPHTALTQPHTQIRTPTNTNSHTNLHKFTHSRPLIQIHSHSHTTTHPHSHAPHKHPIPEQSRGIAPKYIWRVWDRRSRLKQQSRPPGKGRAGYVNGMRQGIELINKMLGVFVSFRLLLLRETLLHSERMR